MTMAEHMNQVVEPEMDYFNYMGKPLPENARTEAYKHCKAMGLNSAKAWECVQAVANHLERDHPYEAQAAGMKFLDLTGTYRVMAALLAACAGGPQHGDTK
jgi:hypothetical protein